MIILAKNSQRFYTGKGIDHGKVVRTQLNSWVRHWSCLLLVAVLTVKECHKVVQKLYVPNEFRREILYVVMSYVVGSLALEYVVII